MAKYVAIAHPAAWSDSCLSWQDRPTCVVHEDDPAPKPTGLVDASGTPLYRLSERIPIGFHNRFKNPEAGADG